MKRLFSLIVMTLFALGLMAEAIPAGYYESIDGKQDSVLKSALSLLVRGGERYEYGPNQYHSTDDAEGKWKKGDLKAYGTWQALPQTDMHPDGIVWDMYSNCVRYYPNKLGDSGCSLNIEHCLPKSWWGWWSKNASNQDTREESWRAYKDLYNLNPSDAQANSNKSNYAPGHVQKGDKFDNGSFRMDSKSKSQYNYICFEPEEQYRGDFARAYFYVATAYEFLEWKADYSQYADTKKYLVFSDAIQQVLLDWHRADPVSDKERCRADRISDIQHNRNPYIDYPELVEYIWGEKKGQAVDLSALTCEFKTDVCPEPILPTPGPIQYDTLINLPAIAKNAVANYTNGTIQGAEANLVSNGTASCTMGSSTKDGEISFSGLNLTDTVVLDFRASAYNTAGSMQLDIYINNDTTPLRTIEVTVEKNTRDEIHYYTTLPKTTTSFRILSVGGSTSKRACMQELYLLSPKKDTTPIEATETEAEGASKMLRDGQLIILRNNKAYSIQGQQIR